MSTSTIESLWSMDIPRLTGCNAIVKSVDEYPNGWVLPQIYHLNPIAAIGIDEASGGSSIDLENGYTVSVSDWGDISIKSTSGVPQTEDNCELHVTVSTKSTSTIHGATSTLTIPVCVLHGPLHIGHVQYYKVGTVHSSSNQTWIAPNTVTINNQYAISPIKSGNSTSILSIDKNSAGPTGWSGDLNFPASGVGASRFNDRYVKVTGISVNDAIYREGVDVVAIFDHRMSEREPKPVGSDVVLYRINDSSRSTDAGYPFYNAASDFRIVLSRASASNSDVWSGGISTYKYIVSRTPGTNQWILSFQYNNGNLVHVATATSSLNMPIGNGVTIPLDNQYPPSAGWDNGVCLCGIGTLYESNTSSVCYTYDYIGECKHSDSRSGSLHVPGRHVIQYYQARDIKQQSFDHWGQFAGSNVSGGSYVSYDKDSKLYRRGVVTSHIYDNPSLSTDTVDMSPICGIGVLRSPVLISNIAHSAGSRVFRDFCIGIDGRDKQAFGVGPGTGLSGYYLALKAGKDIRAAQLYGWYYKHRHAPPYTGTSADTKYTASVAGSAQGLMEYYCNYLEYYEPIGATDGIYELSERTYTRYTIDIKSYVNGSSSNTTNVDIPICFSSDDIIDELRLGNTVTNVKYKDDIPDLSCSDLVEWYYYERDSDSMYKRRVVSSQWHDISTIVMGDPKRKDDSAKLYIDAGIVPFTGPDMGGTFAESDRQVPLFIQAASATIDDKNTSDSNHGAISCHCSWTREMKYFKVNDTTESDSDYSSSSFTGVIKLPLAENVVSVGYSDKPIKFDPKPGASFDISKAYNTISPYQYDWVVVLSEREGIEDTTKTIIKHIIKKHEVTEYYFSQAIDGRIPYTRYVIGPGTYDIGDPKIHPGFASLYLSKVDCSNSYSNVPYTNVSYYGPPKIESGYIDDIKIVKKAINDAKAYSLPTSREYSSSDPRMDKSGDTRRMCYRDKRVFTRYCGAYGVISSANLEKIPICSCGAGARERNWYRMSWSSDSNTWYCNILSQFGYSSPPSMYIQLSSSSSSGGATTP